MTEPEKIAGAVCGGGLLSREIKKCPVCNKITRILRQHSFGGYVVTSFCGHCGAAWQEGEILKNDRAKGIQFVKDNWKHGRRSWVVVAEILKQLEEPMPWDKPCPECEGTGIKRWKHRESPHHSSGATTKCPVCHGTGKDPNKETYPAQEEGLINPDKLSQRDKVLLNLT